MDTIAAISTAPGLGGIGIIRLSGKDAFDIALKLFKNNKIKSKEDIVSNTINYGHIYDGDILIDEVMCSFFKAPKTYTKEDVVEINVHGGIIISKKILSLCVKNGAKIAEPGEFTKRAFLNGRIDLSQVEGIATILSAKSEIEANISNQLLTGKLLNLIKQSKKNLLNILMHLEVNIDYPEYDNPELTQKEILDTITEEYDKFLNFEKNFDIGDKIREGISMVLIGKPNSGKSSLLNYLVNKERAIVTDIPGTTRDTIEEIINISGFPIKIIDTAGIRSSSDKIEQIGIERSIDLTKKPDIIVAIFDTSKNLDQEDHNILNIIKNNNIDKNIIFLLNKSDIEAKFNISDFKNELKKYSLENNNIIKISTLTKQGLNEFINKLTEFVDKISISKDNDLIIIHERQKNIISETTNLLKETLNEIGKIPDDILSLKVQSIVNKLNELTGENVREEILNEIFSNFCLGK